MEVLQGNQSGSKHSRRRLDRIALGEHRALDWGHQESDINLQPISPLALEQILTQPDGFLDLVPRTANTASVSTPITEPETGEIISERCSLLTLHDSADLLQRCKKILVENALVKDKGDRQL